MDKLSWFDIIKKSWHLSFARASFFVYGGVLSIPILVQVFFPSLSTDLSPALIQEYIAHNPFSSCITLLLFFSSIVFGKSRLILGLAEALKEKKSRPQTDWRSFALSLKKGFLIDSRFAFFSILLITVVALPSLMAMAIIGTVSSVLTFLSLSVLLPVLFTASLIREVLYLYLLLTSLRFQSSLETSIHFFNKYRSIIFSFGFFILGLSLLFTFSSNLVMLGIVALLRSTLSSLSEGIIISGGTFILFAWYEVFRQAMWLIFFEQLARPQNNPEKEGELIIKEGVTETSSL